MTHSQSVDEAFEAWLTAQRWAREPRSVKVWRMIFTAGWDAALAAQQRAYEDAKRRMTEADAARHPPGSERDKAVAQ